MIPQAASLAVPAAPTAPPPTAHPTPVPDATPPPTVGDFTSAAEIATEPAPECVIEDAVYRGGVTVIAGESGAGKSFVVTGAGAAVAEGCAWHGRDVVRGSVAYVAFEADALSRRFQALLRHGSTLEDLYVLRASDPLSPETGNSRATRSAEDCSPSKCG